MAQCIQAQGEAAMCTKKYGPLPAHDINLNMMTLAKFAQGIEVACISTFSVSWKYVKHMTSSFKGWPEPYIRYFCRGGRRRPENGVLLKCSQSMGAPAGDF